MNIESYDGPTAPEVVLRDVKAVWDAEWDDLHTEEPAYTWEALGTAASPRGGSHSGAGTRHEGAPAGR